MRLTLLILITILASCRVFKPKQWCYEQYPPIVSDSTYIDTLIVSDTVLLVIPETSIVFDTVFLPPNIIFEKDLRNGGLSAKVSIKKGKLSLKVISDSLKIEVEKLKETINNYKFQTKTVEEPCKREHLTKFNIFCSYFFWIVLILAILIFLLKFFTKK